MKITIFTSNQSRHNYLINLLTEVCDTLFVVQESRTILPGLVTDLYPESKIMKEYFLNVRNAQTKIFGEQTISSKKSRLKLLPISAGDLNYLKLDQIPEFFESDFYLVFGSSYIKNPLIDFLILKKAINIHMGVSPYYRGTDCNFWALFDNNVNLVGSTIHLLSKGLDNGPILYHAMPYKVADPFEYSMLACKSAFYSIRDFLVSKNLASLVPVDQDKKLEIRYSKNIEFNDQVITKYKKIDIDIDHEFDESVLINPYFLKKN